MTTLRHWDATLRTSPDAVGDVEDVPGMAGKTVVRDSSGDAALRRVALTEHVEVGTAATGKARLRPGTPTAAGHLGFRTNGRPLVFVGGSARDLVTPQDLRSRPAMAHKQEDANAMSQFYAALLPVTIVATTLEYVIITPFGDIGVADTDYAVLELIAIADADDMSPVTLMSVTTEATGPDAMGGMFAGTPITLAVAQTEVPVGKYVYFHMGKEGAGRVMPAFSLHVHYSESFA